jgi:hypothetical protein
MVRRGIIAITLVRGRWLLTTGSSHAESTKRRSSALPGWGQEPLM